MSLPNLGVSISRTRATEMGKFLFLGPLGVAVHPVDFEKLHERGIDDLEAVRRAAVRSFDERWNRQVRNASWARERAA